jgi:hypothetical protein
MLLTSLHSAKLHTLCKRALRLLDSTQVVVSAARSLIAAHSQSLRLSLQL